MAGADRLTVEEVVGECCSMRKHRRLVVRPAGPSPPRRCCGTSRMHFTTGYSCSRIGWRSVSPGSEMAMHPSKASWLADKSRTNVWPSPS
jgi:hypothetical protein